MCLMNRDMLRSPACTELRHGEEVSLPVLCLDYVKNTVSRILGVTSNKENEFGTLEIPHFCWPDIEF